MRKGFNIILMFWNTCFWSAITRRVAEQKSQSSSSIKNRKKKKVNARYKTSLLYLAILALSVGQAGAEEPTPPLLRPPWVEAEKARMLNWLSAMQKRKGEVRGHWWILDRSGRSFILSGTGLDFLILESFPVPVPHDIDAPLHMAEARALYSDGHGEEAARLWKTFNALAALKDIPAYQEKAASQSAERLKETGLSFVGPIVVFRAQENRTLVSHPEHGFRFSVDQEYRAARFRFRNGNPLNQEPGEKHTLALKRKLDGESGRRKEAVIIISSDVLRSAVSARACRGLWRERTGLTPGSPGMAQQSEEVLRESENELLLSVAPTVAGAWLEFYRVKQSTCLHIRILVPEYSIMEKSMQNALVLEGREFQDPLELYDRERALEIFDDLYATLSGP